MSAQNARRRRTTRKASPRSVPVMRLPAQSQPVFRGVSADPLRKRVGASNEDCTHCLLACSRIGGRLRSICESLCAAVCIR